MYTEEDMLMLSGIQHYMFCPRQWALIHMEQEWEDNRLTVEGHLLHKRVDDPFYRQKNGGTITLRSVPIASKELGLYGISDAIELIPSKDEINWISHPQYSGHWLPLTIEYKRGKPKVDERDEIQLTAQVMCLEEMYKIHIDQGALYYGETKHRQIIGINESLRNLTKECAEEMHRIFGSGVLPCVEKRGHCRNCSLRNLCIPSSKECPKASFYLNKYLYEETT